jgi:hypothetical protein
MHQLERFGGYKVEYFTCILAQRGYTVPIASRYVLCIRVNNGWPLNWHVARNWMEKMFRSIPAKSDSADASTIRIPLSSTHTVLQ